MKDNRVKSNAFILLFALICCQVLSCSAFAEEVGEETLNAAAGGNAVKLIGNIGSEDYSGYAYAHADPVTSYISKTAAGFRLVWVNTDKISFMELSNDFRYISHTSVPRELSVFGGFFEGKDAYYIAFGQNNPEQDDNREVIRVVKYDKNLNRLGQTSCLGMNTVEPFASGTLRMAESEGVLYIRTAHKMYADDPCGCHHQANLTMQIRESDMSLISSFYDVMNVSLGYVSHSFNQFIMVDDEKNIVALDHGDAHPRSAVLGRYSVKAGETPFFNGSYRKMYDNADIIEYPGDTGENFTGAAVGGLTYSGSNYLTVGYCGSLNELKESIANVYVSCTSRSNLTSEATTINYLSSYSQNGNITPCVPFIIKVGPDQFVVLWEERKVTIDQKSDYVIKSPDRDAHNDLTGQIVAVKIDGNGKTIGGPVRSEGHLSDCAPVYDNGSIYWFTSDHKNLKRNALSTGTLTVQSNIVTMPAGVEVFDGSLENARLLFTKLGDFPYDISDESLEQYLLVMKDGQLLTEDKDYTSNGMGMSGESENDGTMILDYCYKDLNGMGDYYGEYTAYGYPVRKKTVCESLQNKNKGICLKWEQELGALGYVIERSTDGGAAVMIADLPEKGIAKDYVHETISWTDTKVSAGSTYTYSIKAYITDGTKRIYAKPAQKLSITRNDDKSLVTPDKPQKNSKPAKVSMSYAKSNKKKTISLKWKNVTGATGYEVQYAIDKKFKTGKKTKKSTKTSYKIKKLKKGKTYYVRVRAYWMSGNKKVYGAFSKVKAVKVKK